MSDAVSALNGARFKGFVMVQEEPLQGMITVRGDLASDAMANAMKAIGTSVPAARWVVFEGNDEPLWMSPDELLILCPYTEVNDRLARISKAMGNEHHLVADVSDARALFKLSGDGVREVLAKLSPADVSPASLAIGEVRRTRLAQVAAAFWLTDETTVKIVCFRSVAQYVFDLLKAASAPDTEVGFFAQGKS